MKTGTKKLEFDSSSNEEKPPPKRPTRQASYRTFNSTKEQEHIDGSNFFTQQTYQQNH
jgi:hypothetical protein